VPERLQKEGKLCVTLTTAYSTTCTITLTAPADGWQDDRELDMLHAQHIANLPLVELYKHVFVRGLFVNEQDPGLVTVK
jgi:hypothetical protein